MSMKFLAFMILFFDLNSYKIFPPVDKVTLYPTGAYVERIQKKDVKKGVGVWLVENLPSEIYDHSVVVSADGVSILDVSIKKEQMTEVFNKRLHKLNTQLKKLEEKRKELENNIDVINARIEYYKNLSKSLSSNLPSEFFKRRFETKEFGSVISFITRGLKDAFRRKRLSEKQLEEIKDKIDKIKREISDLRAYGAKAKKEIKIKVSSDKPGKTTLKIAYFRGNALWKPLYRVDTDPLSGELLITMKAQVRQAGGEDWRNVKLMFSTAEPVISGTPPVPNPWIVDFSPEHPPVPVARERILYEKKALSPMAKVPPESISTREKEEEKQPLRPVEERGVTYIFRSGGRVTVTADNKPHFFTIISRKIKAEFLYRFYPDYSPFGYLEAQAELPENFPIIGGKLVLFQRGSYVGEARSKFTPASDKIKLPTGVDKNFSLEKKLLRKKEFTEGVFSKSVRINLAYQVLLKNPYNRKVKIEVLSRVPVSRNEQIKVKIVKITPEAEINSVEGFVKWKLQLSKNEKIKLYYEFDLTYPKGRKIRGL